MKELGFIFPGFELAIQRISRSQVFWKKYREKGDENMIEKMKKTTL